MKNEKILLLLLMLTAVSLFSQESLKPESPYISVFTRYEISQKLNNYSENKTLSVSGIEIFLGKKVYGYSQLLFQYYIEGNHSINNKYLKTTPYSFGILLGVGGYLSDYRNNGIGWSSTLTGSAGVKINLPKIIRMSESPTMDDYEEMKNIVTHSSKFIEYVVELNFTTRYNIATHFGIHLGFVLGLDILSYNNDLSMRYGVSFGFII